MLSLLIFLNTFKNMNVFVFKIISSKKAYKEKNQDDVYLEKIH
jgi:hypothetical protein